MNIEFLFAIFFHSMFQQLFKFYTQLRMAKAFIFIVSDRNEIRDRLICFSKWVIVLIL